ncbi:MAG: protein-glutamate O-methyltransferase CheR [Treponemataceae bacterium]|nr:protein-glutamate O-methyltransferase CheR [Treponemataceae bacterium]
MPDTILSDIDFERFRKIIYDESGITFSSTNRPVLDSRIKEILREKKLATAADYFKVITTDHEEMKRMLDSVTTNLTRFFRNQPHFDALIHYVIPHVLEEKRKTGDRTVRIWSAGCSTGEEPYTIAMIMKKILPPGYLFSIMASDISLKSLMVAQRGFYSDSKVVGIPPDYLSKCFTKVEGGYQVNRDIMSCIKFDYHNLQHDAGARNLDVIFCRNVMIYFDEPAQMVVLDRFWNSMAAHSYLFIGHSESLFGMKTRFEFLKTDWACLYQKNL